MNTCALITGIAALFLATGAVSTPAHSETGNGLLQASMPMATSASELTGNDLLPACRDFINKQFHTDPLNQGQCIGVIQALAFAAPDQPFQTSRSCPPENVTVGQLTTVVVRWLEQRPQDWNKPFFALVLFALHDTWPCQ
jgi:hypothetical protein